MLLRKDYVLNFYKINKYSNLIKGKRVQIISESSSASSPSSSISQQIRSSDDDSEYHESEIDEDEIEEDEEDEDEYGGEDGEDNQDQEDGEIKELTNFKNQKKIKASEEENYDDIIEQLCNDEDTDEDEEDEDEVKNKRNYENLDDSFDELLAGFDTIREVNNDNEHQNGVDGEKDVDEENMFAENDVENSVRLQQNTNTTSSAATTSKVSNELKAFMNRAQKSLQEVREFNLDNEEAFKEIKQQLNEIKTAAGLNGLSRPRAIVRNQSMASSLFASDHTIDQSLPNTSSNLNKYKGN